MYKNSFKHEQKRGRFLAVSRDFCTNFCFLRLLWPPRMLKEAAMRSSEVKIISNSKSSYKNWLKTRSIFSIARRPWRLDFIYRVSHGRRLWICSISAFWGYPDLRGCKHCHIGECLSPTGPREDVSLKALGSYAPSALQTDILHRSSKRQIHSPVLPSSLSRDS